MKIERSTETYFKFRASVQEKLKRCYPTGPSDELKSQLYNEDINNVILSDLDIGQYLGYIGAQRPYKDPILIDEIDIGGSEISLESENCQNHLDSCSTCSHEV